MDSLKQLAGRIEMEISFATSSSECSHHIHGQAVPVRGGAAPNSSLAVSDVRLPNLELQPSCTCHRHPLHENHKNGGLRNGC